MKAQWRPNEGAMKAHPCRKRFSTRHSGLNKLQRGSLSELYEFERSRRSPRSLLKRADRCSWPAGTIITDITFQNMKLFSDRKFLSNIIWFINCTPFSSLLESLWILATKSSNGNNFIFSHIISNISKVGQISANIVWSPTFIIVAFHLLLPCHGVDELLTR